MTREALDPRVTRISLQLALTVQIQPQQREQRRIEAHHHQHRPGDVDDLAAKIALALDARPRWPAWGEESVRIVRTTFDWPVVARQTLAEYERMLSARP